MDSQLHIESCKDILSEMRSQPLSWLSPEGIPQMHHDNRVLAEYADRLTKAINREMDIFGKEIAAQVKALYSGD